MPQHHTPPSGNDPWNLERFVQAQAHNYEQALQEIREGDKRSHWMWYIFPQLEGLGTSSTARLYAIRHADEARDYLAHPLLGPRLRTCALAALDVPDRSAHDIFGFPDELKLRSSATLFASVAPTGSVFEQLLQRFFHGEGDPRTLQLLGTP